LSDNDYIHCVIDRADLIINVGNDVSEKPAKLPGAIGAALAYPYKNIVAICGDGDFMMNSQELETAKRLNLNLTVIVLRDNACGVIKWKQTGMDFETFGLDFGNPDFIAYANAYGVEAVRIEKTGQLVEVLKQGFDKDGVQLIEVPIDYSENEKVFFEELKSKTCTI
jgi:acetolactate synthase-1/2/3 large subunit